MSHRCRFSVLKTTNGKISCKFQLEVDCADIQDGYKQGLGILSLISAGDEFSWMRRLVAWVDEAKRYEPWYDYTQDFDKEKYTMVITYL